MSTESQSATLDYLANPSVHGMAASEISVIRTHISIIVLAGSRAYKLKRAVRLPYVDLSTPARRLQACQHELELNKRTAPALYLSVRHIMQDRDGRLSFDGPGEMIDAVVEMRRFEDDALLETLVEREGMTQTLAARLAAVIADFHGNAKVVREVDAPLELEHVLASNERVFSGLDMLPKEKTEALAAALRGELGKHGQMLRVRAAAGKVRHCHGDLHLRNVCVIDGEPTLFDCIEFDDSLATIDVLYDLAFLLMDLWSHGLTAQANEVLNRYLDVCDDEDGMPLVPFFMALRAAVRSHVIATQAAESTGEARSTLQAAACRYLDTGLACLAAHPARLMAIGGLSGSGKSMLAAAVAHHIGPPPGARVLSSDRIRKRLHDLPAQSRLPIAAYQAEVSERVYAEQAERAARIAGAKCVVIADAVFDRESDRARIEQSSVRAGVPFAGFWLEAPSATLLARVKARINDASDADETVVRTQLARQHKVEKWTHVDSGGAIDATVARVLQIIENVS